MPILAQMSIKTKTVRRDKGKCNSQGSTQKEIIILLYPMLEHPIIMKHTVWNIKRWISSNTIIVEYLNNTFLLMERRWYKTINEELSELNYRLLQPTWPWPKAPATQQTAGSLIRNGKCLKTDCMLCHKISLRTPPTRKIPSYIQNSTIKVAIFTCSLITCFQRWKALLKKQVQSAMYRHWWRLPQALSQQLGFSPDAANAQGTMLKGED